MAKKTKQKKVKYSSPSEVSNEAVAYHVPALLSETIEGLDIKPDGVYVDVTFGGGGHSKEILSRLGKNGKLLGFDRGKKVGIDFAYLTFSLVET